VEHGLWYARSAEFMQDPLLDKIRWLRVVGDTIFAAGAVALGVFVAGLATGHSVKSTVDLSPNEFPSARG
jgi:nitric oxide reductase subunit B